MFSSRFRVGSHVPAALLVAATGLFVGACSSGDGTVQPMISDIDDAIDAIEVELGGAQDYFEVSAGLEAVTVVVATDDASTATTFSFADGTLSGPGEPVGADGATFRANAVAFDEGVIFDRVRTELDDPVIIDFAVQGGPEGTVVYDASVATDDGGVLLVLLGPDGTIQGVQAG